MSQKSGKYTNFFEARRGEEEPQEEATQAAQPEQKAVETVQEAAPAQEERRRGRPPGGKSSNPQYVQVGAYVPREVYATTQMGLYKESIRTGKKREFSDLLEELLRSWNERNS